MSQHRTPAQNYNDFARHIDEIEQSPFFKTNLRTAPLYCFDNFLDVLTEKFTGLICDIDRSLIISTDTRCVFINIHNNPSGVRITRFEPGHRHETQVVILENNILYTTGTAGRNVYEGDIRGWSAVGKSAFDVTDSLSGMDVRDGKISDADSARIIFFHNAMVVLAFLNRIDSPRHYVLSESPARIRMDGPKSPRFDNRERWIVLDKEAVIKRYKSRPVPVGTHASPAPHLRRGHFKTLSSEKFVNKIGQKIPVRPSWVGPREWAGTHGLKYRVVSRPGATENQA